MSSLITGGCEELNKEKQVSTEPVQSGFGFWDLLNPGIYLWSWMGLHCPRQTQCTIWGSFWTHIFCLKSRTWRLWPGGPLCIALCYVPVVPIPRLGDPIISYILHLCSVSCVGYLFASGSKLLVMTFKPQHGMWLSLITSTCFIWSTMLWVPSAKGFV